jgi:hypothetical protein
MSTESVLRSKRQTQSAQPTTPTADLMSEDAVRVAARRVHELEIFQQRQTRYHARLRLRQKRTNQLRTTAS